MHFVAIIDSMPTLISQQCFFPSGVPLPPLLSCIMQIAYFVVTLHLFCIFIMKLYVLIFLVFLFICPYLANISLYFIASVVLLEYNTNVEQLVVDIFHDFPLIPLYHFYYRCTEGRITLYILK